MSELPASESVTDLIWVQTSFIGDVVLNTAAIELAARALPRAKQHVVTTSIGAKAIGSHPALASCIVFDKRRGGVLAPLRAMRSVRQQLQPALGSGRRPVVLMAHRSFRSMLLGRFLQAPMIAYEEADASFLATVRVPRVAVLHEAHRIGLLLEPLGVAREDVLQARPYLPAAPHASTASLASTLRKLRDAGAQKLIVLAPGSVWGTKRWTEEGFRELANLLLEDPEIGVVLIGAGPEEATAARIAAAMPERHSERVANLAGQTTLDDLRWLLPEAALVVSNDSSPIHFAAALDVPTVGIFGATVPAMGFGPLSTLSTTVGVELACRPCSAHGPDVCPLGHFRCMRELRAETVRDACRIIGSGPPTSAVRKDGPL